jgi:UDP-glucose 4-epimerase
MTRVLVTGGCGFIGSHMVRTLVQAGHTVTVIDDLSNGHEDTLPTGVRFVRGSLLDPACMKEALTEVDTVYHFAGSIQVAESVLQPAAYYRNNVSASIALFDAMVAQGVRKLIFSSTAAVYAPLQVPVALREDALVDPASPYGETKLAIERALSHFPLQSVSLRYFNAAGAAFGLRERHAPETHLIPLAIAAARGTCTALSVYGADYDTPDGTCIRDYVHVLDLCNAHLAAHQRLDSLRQHSVYNLGGGVGTSVREVLGAVEVALGKSVPHTIAARRAGDVPALVADITRARADLHFTPVHSSIAQIVNDAIA